MLNHAQMHNVFPEGGGGGGPTVVWVCPGGIVCGIFFVILCYFKIPEFSGGGMSGPNDSPLDPRTLNRPYLIREGPPPPLHSPTPSGDLIFMWKLPSITLYMYLVFPKNAPQ